MATKDESQHTPLMRWLGIAAGALAILTFFGISNYQSLFSALGWSNPSASSSDSADLGVCASAAAGVTTANMDAPATAGDKVDFYDGQATAFQHLASSAKDKTLSYDLHTVSSDLGLLEIEWFGTAFGTGGDEGTTATVASLREDESTLESWCQAHTGTR